MMPFLESNHLSFGIMSSLNGGKGFYDFWCDFSCGLMQPMKGFFGNMPPKKNPPPKCSPEPKKNGTSIQGAPLPVISRGCNST